MDTMVKRHAKPPYPDTHAGRRRAKRDQRNRRPAVLTAEALGKFWRMIASSEWEQAMLDALGEPSEKI